MHKLPVSRATLLVAAAFTLSSFASASVIITNYPQTSNPFSSTAIDNGNHLAVGFLMPGGPAYTLLDAKVVVNYNVTSPVTNFAAQIFGSDSFGNPTGPALVSFTTPATFGFGTFDYTLLPQSPLTFTPGGTYWLEISASTGQAGGLAWIGSSPEVTPAGIATWEGYRYQNGVDPPQNLYSFAKPTFQIDGIIAPTTVPEPATLLSIGVSLLVIGGYKARR